jgi:hypothetical protein
MYSNAIFLKSFPDPAPTDRELNALIRLRHSYFQSPKKWALRLVLERAHDRFLLHLLLGEKAGMRAGNFLRLSATI